MLLKNCGHNPNITCINAGVWSEKCNLRLSNPGCGSMSFRFEKSDGLGTPAVSVGDIIHDCSIDSFDIIKMDIEGSEREVFEKYDSSMDKTACFIIETHDRYIPGTSEFINNLLTEKGYSRSTKGENEVYIKI